MPSPMCVVAKCQVALGYDAGKLLNKKNTFNDFIDVTTALTEQGYGDKNKVVASGGSAGGLLMGAIANMAPEKYCHCSACAFCG